jgi:tRNA G18 (ribose-2'-O)-methylase SpoU
MQTTTNTIDNSNDSRNVTDRYKHDRLVKWTTEMIKTDLQQKAFPFAVMMENLVGDFNLSSVLRSCNAMNGREMFYLGRKQYDRRGTVGTHHYTDIINLKDREELLKLKDRYTFVALENTVPQAESIYNFEWPENPLIIIGEEGVGITPETLALCDKFVFIPQYGSVRSLNAAVAGSIAMNDFIAKYVKNKDNLR